MFWLKTHRYRHELQSTSILVVSNIRRFPIRLCRPAVVEYPPKLVQGPNDDDLPNGRRYLVYEIRNVPILFVVPLDVISPGRRWEQLSIIDKTREKANVTVQVYEKPNHGRGCQPRVFQEE